MVIIITLSIFLIKNIRLINLTPSKSLAKSLVFLNILSMAGLPPFLGFAPKVIVLTALFFSNLTNFLEALALISTSVITLYFYLRLFYSSLILFETFSSKTRPTPKINNILTPILSLSIIGNCLISPLVIIS